MHVVRLVISGGRPVRLEHKIGLSKGERASGDTISCVRGVPQTTGREQGSGQGTYVPPNVWQRVAIENQVDVGKEDVYTGLQNLPDGQHLSLGDEPVRLRTVPGLERGQLGQTQGGDVD